MSNKFTDLLNITLSSVNDLFDTKITKVDDAGTMSLKAFVLFTPKSTIDPEALGVYHHWFDDKPGVMLEISLYNGSMYIRAVTPPLGQTTRKRNFDTLNNDGDFMKALREVMLGLIREWRKVAKSRQRASSVQWASKQISDFYSNTELRKELSVTYVENLNRIAVTRNRGLSDSIEHIKWNVEPVDESGKVKVGIEISTTEISKEKLCEILELISQITK